MKNKRVTLVQQPIGLSVLLTSLLLLAVGLIFFSPAALATGVLLLFLWTACRILAERHVSGIEVSRELPARATAGRSFPIKTVLRNVNQRLPAREIDLEDPLAGSSKQDLLLIGARAEIQLSYTGLSKNRGFTTIAPWRITSSWPLGFFEGTATGIFADSHRTLIRPCPFFPPRLRHHLEALREDASHTPVIEFDPTAPFRMLREFRAGDPVRSIHWPGSLRDDTLLVRDLDPPSPEAKRFALLLHSFEPAGQLITPEAFELVLRIVSAVLRTLQNQQIELIYQIYPNKAICIDSRAEFDEQLDRLAFLQRNPVSALRSVRTMLEELPPCEEIFVISDCPIVHWKKAIEINSSPLTLLDSESLLSSSRPSLRVKRHPAKTQ